MDIKLKYKFRTDWCDSLILEKDQPKVAARKMLHDNIFHRLVHLCEDRYDIWYKTRDDETYRVGMTRTPILIIDGRHFVLTEDFSDDSVPID